MFSRLAFILVALMGASREALAQTADLGAPLILSPIPAVMEVLDRPAEAPVFARIGLETTADELRARLIAEANLTEVRSELEIGLGRRWLEDSCGDDLATSDAMIATTDDEQTLRLHFSIRYQRNQCAIGRSGLFRATGRAAVDLSVRLVGGQPRLEGRIIDGLFDPDIELLGFISFGGVGDEEARALLLSILQDQLDRELDKANREIATAILESGVELDLKLVRFHADDGTLWAELDAAARAGDEELTALIRKLLPKRERD